ncbi:unnamed protein product [Prunus armeniaca]
MHVREGEEDTMNGSNEGPTFEAPEKVSSDGEHISDFDSESEGDGDDMEGDNEGTSKYRRAVDLKNPEFQLGMQFENRYVLKEALREYFIIHGRKLYFKKNDKTRVKAICEGGLKCPLVGEVSESYHVRVSKTAKRLAKAQIEGNYIQQYARWWDYAEQLKNTNKGVLEGCRPVIGVDAYHLKGPYPGQILTDVGVYVNNGIFPIAYDVAEIENKDSWIWFLYLLIEDLGITNGLSWVFISNKQKGIILAIAHVLPIAEHRMCVTHLYNNFIATHLGLTLKHMLWAAARATTIPWWEAEMEKMKEEDLEAWKWLVQRPPKNWTRSHFHPRMANRRTACCKLKYPVGSRIFKII